jgi:hypothetical protein
MRFVDPRGLKIRSSGSQGPDQFPRSTCFGTPGAACLTYGATLTPCVKAKDCTYKFDANVSASAWREFVSREAINRPSSDPLGLKIGQHESLHVGDYLSAYAGNKLDALYQSEGFSSLAACEQARSGLAAWLESYRDAVLAESGGKRD